jgi:MoaD family protein
MTKITVRFLANLKLITHKYEEELEIQGQSLRDVINLVSIKYGGTLLGRIMNLETGKPLPHMMILVNGIDLRLLDDLDTKVNDGDIVAFVPPIAGG